MESFGISVIGPDIDDAGYSAAISCREGAFVECDFLDRFRCKYRQQAEQMADIVKRRSVEHHKVLVRATASHINSGKSFHAALHARHQLNGLDDIGFAQHHRHVLDHLLRDFHCAHISGLYAGVLAADNSRGLK